eukprot:gnl/TRDRNA2_/TRDRNA2_184249_c0_seq1.p1 gnl/TRDRNA2_/TRDRNA2_184249_c0~~gnl/TRDRNA2_/TRDRNA2_184249_c0_seq1.p1  ORF type:complete len:225 (+),score=42.50 gnl/TRDRNA2_/TRDRNA2_184249_c0_seq1:62-676(+)
MLRTLILALGMLAVAHAMRSDNSIISLEATNATSKQVVHGPEWKTVFKNGHIGKMKLDEHGNADSEWAAKYRKETEMFFHYMKYMEADDMYQRCYDTFESLYKMLPKMKQLKKRDGTNGRKVEFGRKERTAHIGSNWAKWDGKTATAGFHPVDAWKNLMDACEQPDPVYRIPSEHCFPSLTDKKKMAINFLATFYGPLRFWVTH